MTCVKPEDLDLPSPGAVWNSLPLPGLMLNAEGRVVAMNDAAEVWLNMSRNSTIGKKLDGEPLAKKLRVVPSLMPLVTRVMGTDEALYQGDVQFEIGDRARGP